MDPSPSFPVFYHVGRAGAPPCSRAPSCPFGHQHLPISFKPPPQPLSAVSSLRCHLYTSLLKRLSTCLPNGHHPTHTH